MSMLDRTLAIDTATEACSIALFESGTLIANDHRVLGRGHAERLVPMIADLPDKGRAGRILVSLGPGSFTGVRIGIAAARALGVAWQSEVFGYPTLALIAAMARGADAAPVTVCMNGGHGEWFVADFSAAGEPVGPLASLTPEMAARRGAHDVIAGNRAAELGELLGPQEREIRECLPDARECLRLPSDALTKDMTPIYGRGADAVPQKERRVK
ncbi:tRNA (adenosine(37)-N6)-threonylcarbamoyltransferase complex dimerization subunit type 1 TsaB [Erythrobacter sp. MTPC3]|uniref:tRNA (adenosine(37)-N6)-threonylcarbamoyltransferase complex dimerization subunit type 1 TsaB n=1 Tax=Erythrobacter sp. MTPC3 TaxID=3056564 RepID=UPI0036F3B2A5